MNCFIFFLISFSLLFPIIELIEGNILLKSVSKSSPLEERKILSSLFFLFIIFLTWAFLVFSFSLFLIGIKVFIYLFISLNVESF